MTTRPPFEATHNCICSHADIPILDFYKGYFDTVYIVLHPFYKKDVNDKISQVITWKEFMPLAGFADIKQLDIALRTSILGLREEYENKEYSDRLHNASELNDIWIPSEGLFQDSLEHEILKSLQEFGHHYIFVADEWGYERKLVFIQDMIDGKDNTILTWGAQRNWYTNSNEILYTTHWDSHFTMLCSDKKTVERILATHPFEGFYCDETTEIYWSTMKTDIHDN